MKKQRSFWRPAANSPQCNYHKMEKKRSLKTAAAAIAIPAALVFIGNAARKGAGVPQGLGSVSSDPAYSEEEEVMKAIALSFLVYGTEFGAPEGSTVDEIISKNELKVIAENAGIIRLDKDDPATALIDTAAFVRQYAGNFRMLTQLSDEKSGFYGAAFCDDEEKCVWIAFSGCVTARDAASVIDITFRPGLSLQEKLACQLFMAAADSEEVSDKDYSVMLTGHSLGGGLAAEVSLITGCKAVSINGPCGVAIDKMAKIRGCEKAGNRITSFLTDPKGTELSWLSVIQRLIFVGSWDKADVRMYKRNDLTLDPHSVFSFIKKDGNDFVLPLS